MSAFVFVNFDVLDKTRQEQFLPRFEEVLKKVGGRIALFGDVVDHLEGEIEPYSRAAVLEFPTLEAARAFYRSDDYAPLLAERREIQRARMFIVVPPRRP
jgi:uncharacterized protein (DUF1330 family)